MEFLMSNNPITMSYGISLFENMQAPSLLFFFSPKFSPQKSSLKRRKEKKNST